jgi:AcrR family transcriptional regulator
VAKVVALQAGVDPQHGIERCHEEAALVARLPDSARVRRVVADLEALMRAEGFLHLNTSDLARRLRCSKATLYRVAETREALFQLVIERWLARLRDEGWAGAQSATGWSARLVEYLRPALTHTEGNSFAFWRDLSAFPGGYEALMAHQRRRVEGLEEIISGGVADGTFEPIHARLVSELFQTVVRQLVNPGFVASLQLSVHDAFVEWYRVLEYGLVRRDGASEATNGRRP